MKFQFLVFVICCVGIFFVIFLPDPYDLYLAVFLLFLSLLSLSASVIGQYGCGLE